MTFCDLLSLGRSPHRQASKSTRPITRSFSSLDTRRDEYEVWVSRSLLSSELKSVDESIVLSIAEDVGWISRPPLVVKDDKLSAVFTDRWTVLRSSSLAIHVEKEMKRCSVI